MLMFCEPPDRLWGYDVSAIADLAGKVKAMFEDLQEPAAATMMDFDERDLLTLVDAAGFKRIRLESIVDVPAGSLMSATSLGAFLDAAPNPFSPTVRECIAAALTDWERERFVAHLERAIAEDLPRQSSAVAYLKARKQR